MRKKEQNAKETCYRAMTYAGAWKIWPNPVWYPPEGVGEVRFDYETLDTFHQPIRSIKGLATDLDGRIFGIRSMSNPKESGYHLEGRVSIGGKSRSAFTSSRLFERPDGSLVDVGVFIVRNVPAMKCLPPHEGWHQPTADELATEMDDAAAAGDPDVLYARLQELTGYPHGDLASASLNHRSSAIGERLKGNIAQAEYVEKLSDEYLEKYRKALAGRGGNPDKATRQLKNKLLK